MKNSQLARKNLILHAFLDVRDGWSAEYVVCEPDTNARFIAKCREMGTAETSSKLNFQLLNLRKQGLLTSYPSTKRKPKGSATIQKAVENGIRFLERQFNATVDNIICDSIMRDEFDALMQVLMPGCSVLESRYAALTLRKKNKLKPEVVGRVIASTGGRIIPFTDLKVDDISTDPGAYLFFDHENTLYAGKADNLQRRIGDHISTWMARELISQIKNQRRAQIFVAIHVLTPGIAATSLAAYETEIIRSRNPSHNRSGKVI